jgi:hypothetical protein
MEKQKIYITWVSLWQSSSYTGWVIGYNKGSDENGFGFGIGSFGPNWIPFYESSYEVIDEKNILSKWKKDLK